MKKELLSLILLCSTYFSYAELIINNRTAKKIEAEFYYDNESAGKVAIIDPKKSVSIDVAPFKPTKRRVLFIKQDGAKATIGPLGWWSGTYDVVLEGTSEGVKLKVHKAASKASSDLPVQHTAVIAKKSKVLEARREKLSIITKTDYPLYYTIYQPEITSFIERVQKFLKKNPKIEKYIPVDKPTKLSAGLISLEVPHNGLLAISANSGQIEGSVDRKTLETGIKHAIIGDNKYLIIHRINSENYIYTEKQWKESLSGTKTGGIQIVNNVLQWVLKKILNQK